MTVECPICGTPSADDKRFCGDCGASLDRTLGSIKQYLDANLGQEIQILLKKELRDQR
jgi:uncharacterized membrane protein YvbJ